MHTIHLTLQSRNAKTGPIPVSTTSADSCPPSCPLAAAGCYAKSGPLGMLWAAVSRTKPGATMHHGKNNVRTLTWDGFTAAIKALPAGALWRHNQAGDLPGVGDKIDAKALGQLARANKGKRGFTYTHKPVKGRNAAAIAKANAAGFTVNLSADNLTEADELSAAGVGPVVTLLPAEVTGNEKLFTPAGRRVVVCPATYRDDVTCASCALCAVATREVIVGFPAHGASKAKASMVARGA
jgi:hypothetical protein